MLPKMCSSTNECKPVNLSDLIPELPTIAAQILIADFLRYVLTAGTIYLVVWRVFSKQLDGRRILPDAPKPNQMRHEFMYSMSTVCIFTMSGVFVYIMEKLGYSRIYVNPEKYGWVWWIVSLAVITIAHDAYFYWTHRLLHRPWWFAHVHRIHHKSLHPTPWAAYSFHPLEAVLQTLFFVVFVHLVPLHQAVLFIFLVGMIIRNVIGHCGYEFIPWHAATRGILRWSVTNSHHHFHHARNKGNYGLYFTWWDRCMNTEDTQYISHGDTWFLNPPASLPTKKS
jgi:Delta7-sterol 5-desaturase